MGSADDKPGSERWIRTPGVLWRRYLGGLVLLPEGAPAPVTVAFPADLVWERLDRPRSVAEIAADLAGTFDDDEGEVAGYVGATLDRLADVEAVQQP